MIKKLQLKFILLSMLALALVLIVIMVGINVANYHTIIKEADSILSILSENKGTFPRDNRKNDKHFPPHLSPETPYESRYFSVLLEKDSHAVIQVETSRIISVDTSQAIDYAQEVIHTSSQKGFFGNFRYMKYTEGSLIRITFLDCRRKLDAFHNFLFASIGISLAGYIIVFVLIAFFSNKIIQPISESYQKQKRFITAAGHEIKTPITIINADIDVLEMDYGENEWLTDIKKQINRLTELTNNLVYLARMEEVSGTMQMIEFPLSDLVSETASSFSALSQTQNKEFQCKIQPMLSMTGNEKAICQLINILLDNALKYSPTGGFISLTLEKQNKMLVLSVCNTTENPIPKETLPLLFERFYRMDTSRNSQTGGYGIGLSVAKAIVTTHHGKIKAQTDDDRTLQIIATFPK